MPSARITGYHPLDVSTEKEKSREGNPVDVKGLPLMYLEDAGINGNRVGLSADLEYFNINDEITIDGFPGIVFVIRDTGGGFKNKNGSAFDIPVKTRAKADSITGNRTWKRRVRNIYANGGARDSVFLIIGAALLLSAGKNRT